MSVFLFTDIEGSTTKWEKHRVEMSRALALHDEIIGRLIGEYGGKVIKHTGDGFFAIFERGEPLQCAIAIQKEIEKQDWRQVGDLRVRIALNAGAAEKRGDDYFGPVINRTARILSAGWGGQIILTPEVRMATHLPAGAVLQELGSHLLKDLTEPQVLYGLIHPDLTIKDFPPLRSLSAHIHNLPVQSTPFIGREKEVKEIIATIRRQECHILTLIGPGGIGKTRLALQAGAECIEDFKNGVYYIPLAPLGSVNFLILSIAEILKFTFYSNEEIKDQIMNFLREKEMLLIMDGFENFLEAATLLVEILQNAPRIRILVTSRERLNLQGEWIFYVDGLAYPEENKGIEVYDSVRLFIQSAQRTNPSFIPAEDEKSNIVKICRLVQGSPLGIELAASWTKTLSCLEIVQEIERGLDFLTTRCRDVPERHRSLRAVFESSWSLLSEEERRIYRRLSIFRGGFTRTGAERVAGTSLELLTSFVDKSLLKRKLSGRYEMPEILRQYSRAKLDEIHRERKAVEEVYARYYAEFVDQVYAQYFLTEPKTFFKEIGEEINNVRATWDWIVENRHEELIGEMIDGFYEYYVNLGWSAEGEKSFARATEQFSTIRNNVLGRILLKRAFFNFRLAQYDKAQQFVEEAVIIFKESNYQSGIADFYKLNGHMHIIKGEWTEAGKAYEECLSVWKRLNNRYEIGYAINHLGSLASQIGDYKKAEALLKESLDIFKNLNCEIGAAYAMGNLSIVKILNKEYSEAQRLMDEVLEIFKNYGDRFNTAVTLQTMADIAQEMEDYDKARDFYLECFDIRKELGDRRGMTIALNNLGRVYLHLGEEDKCRECLKKAIKLVLEAGLDFLVSDVLLNIAEFFSKKGEDIKAFESVAVSLRFTFETKLDKERAERLFSGLKGRIPEAEANLLLEKVRQMTFKELANQFLRDW
ncbi:MAG: tetratricopeptide repeat protein [candidate division WOR-3 bacterium]